MDTKKYRARFCRVLMQLMREREMSQADLARGTGLTPSGVNRLIRDGRLPRTDTLFRIATTLGVSVEYFAPPDYIPAESVPPSMARIHALMADLTVSERMMAIGALEMWKAMSAYNPDYSPAPAPEPEPETVQ